MFTARSEYRLTVRSDNSDFRLTPKAIDLRIMNREQADIFRQKQEMRKSAMNFI